MKEINIARTIVTKRREKGITQDDLANYIGVSKASVSKWETGQSYPDILLLPQLATFFNISIDALMGYEPQMEKTDIRKLHHSLSAAFASQPFDEVLEHCRDLTKEYFSCFPLLFQIGTLLTNYSTLPNDAAKTASVLLEAQELFRRVKTESDDLNLSKQALHMEAFCCLSLGQTQEMLALLEGPSEPIACIEPLLATAYHLNGKIKEAKAVLQVGTYQYLLAILNTLLAYLSACMDEAERFTELYQRTLAITDIFQVKTLHPSIMMSFYMVAAQGNATLGNREEAIKLLEHYTDLVTGDIYPLHLGGDAFFDLLDDWLDQSILITEAPRDEKTVRQSMVDAVTQNPAFAALGEERRFQKIVERLKNNCQEG